MNRVVHDELVEPVAADVTVDLGQAGCGDLTAWCGDRLLKIRNLMLLPLLAIHPITGIQAEALADML